MSDPVDLASDQLAPQDEEALAEEAQVQKCLRDAEELKQEGNEHFRAKRWNEALAAYRSGLGRLPKRRLLETEKGKGKEREADDTDDEEDEGAGREDGGAMGSKEKGKEKAEESVQTPSLEAELECARARAIMNANAGACYVKLEEWTEAVSACSEALKDDPTYVKALQRRASANEKIGSWSSLSSAQEDYNTLLTILPSDSPHTADIKRSLASLKPRLEAAQKAETAEMLDKLKGLGNNILGRFGLSTDNFQFTPNGEGGYSMNFAR
ncbi:TPR-like protein [Daedalea quercina L-15889]|uniref:TPR-like protein n=1 Tax=Daedalea quercina L-15889 TaxID=1314783 RepID=A0A165UNI0_9APHY|nr:TPR-like protein [Daedalea quercina L-15889]